jgi:hypothetical protein
LGDRWGAMAGCHNHLHTVVEEKSFGNETLCPSRRDREHDDSEGNKKKSRFKSLSRSAIGKRPQ